VFSNRKAGDGNHPWVMTPNPLRTANLRAPYSQARSLLARNHRWTTSGRRRRRSGGVPPAFLTGTATSASPRFGRQ